MSGLLYRAHRPQSFEELVGQSHVVQTIQEALKQGKVAHAYLFCGPRGVGKTTVARLIAKGVNCLEGKDGIPCAACAACEAIAHNSALDIIEIDAASNRGIDEMRELREKVRVAPTVLKKRVVIIDEAHMLTKEAFNALLKTLEEPPEHTMFILATTEPQKIHATIQSRCQRFDFHLFHPQELVEQIQTVVKKEGKTIEEGAAVLIAQAGKGSSRDTLSLLSQMFLLGENITEKDVRAQLGLTEETTVAGVLAALLASNASGAIQMVHAARDEGVDIRILTEALLETARSWMLQTAGVEQHGIGTEDPGLSEMMSVSVLQVIITKLLEAKRQQTVSIAQELPLELAFLEIVAIQGMSVHAPTNGHVNEQVQANKIESLDTKKETTQNTARQKIQEEGQKEEQVQQEQVASVPIEKQETDIQVEKSIQTNAAQGEGVSLPHLLERWGELHTYVQQHSTALAMSFKTLVPIDIQQEEVVLACAFDLHCEKWQDLESIKLFQNGFNEVFQEVPTLRVMHERELTAEQQKRVEAWRAREEQMRSQAMKDTAQSAKAVFGQTIAAVPPAPVHMQEAPVGG